MHARLLHFAFGRSFPAAALLAALSAPQGLVAAPHVEFDFARTVECRDVTPLDSSHQRLHLRLVELTLPISARFRDVEPQDVEELTIEISGAAAGLRVYDFAPATQLASDVAKEIETTTTTKSGRSLDATLGGALPVPFATKVATVTPSISAGTSSGETTTEKLNRLPPKQAIVVSGTSLEGRGVFFKLKRSSQRSLEGIHMLAVTFIAPASWHAGEVQVACSAAGQKKVLWMSQSATLGREASAVRLFVTQGTPRQVARPVVRDAPSTPCEVPGPQQNAPREEVSMLDAVRRGVPSLAEEGTEAKDAAAE